MSGGTQGRRPQNQSQGWAEIKCTEAMGHGAFFAKQPATEQGWRFLSGCIWGVLRVWQFCVRGGEFKEPGKNWIFLEEGPALCGPATSCCGTPSQMEPTAAAGTP